MTKRTANPTPKAPRKAKAPKITREQESAARLEVADAQITTDVEGNRFEQDGTPAFEATPELKAKAPFRGAGFVEFRAKHEPRWCEKAQRNVHDNEDDIAEQLAYEITTFGWWSAPLVIEHLGGKLDLLRAKYASLNAGMVRMNLGNQIRASIRRRAKLNDKAEAEG